MKNLFYIKKELEKKPPVYSSYISPFAYSREGSKPNVLNSIAIQLLSAEFSVPDFYPFYSYKRRQAIR